MNMYNKICLGDIQKSAMRALKVDLLSQDMEKLLVGLDIQYTAGSYSETPERTPLRRMPFPCR
jgi:hypothetical protein